MLLVAHSNEKFGHNGYLKNFHIEQHTSLMEGKVVGGVATVMMIWM